MVATFSAATDIIRTERGLTIAGTRITLYDVMDYYVAQYPPKFIGSLFNLSEATIQGAIALPPKPTPKDVQLCWLEEHREPPAPATDDLRSVEDHRETMSDNHPNPELPFSILNSAFSIPKVLPVSGVLRLFG